MGVTTFAVAASGLLLLVLLVAGNGAAVLVQDGAGPGPGPEPEPGPGDAGQGERNVAAFLMMLRWAEGTAGSNGYRTMFGGRLFTSWEDHPRGAVEFEDKLGRRAYTSAAGAYQFMAVSMVPGGGYTRVNTWDRIAAKLGLTDFSPDSQDAAAVELIREAGALSDVMAGDLDRAVSRVRRIWASLPGAGYGQPEKSMTYLRLAYIAAGGAVA